MLLGKSRSCGKRRVQAPGRQERRGTHSCYNIELLQVRDLRYAPAGLACSPLCHNKLSDLTASTDVLILQVQHKSRDKRTMRRTAKVKSSPFRQAETFVILFVALFSLTVPAVAQTNGEKLSNIKNFGRINETYYRGAQPEGRDYADLASLGVKAVINLASDDAEANEKAMVEGAGMKYYQIPMTTHEPPTAAQLVEFQRIVSDPASQPVYVHCVGGKHRTGVMTAIYRMTQGWTADQAFQEMKLYNFGADFLHSEFKSFVYDYYKQLVRTHPEPVEAVLTTKTAVSN